MKTKIKRHSRSVLSVVLAVCMLLSCMTVGIIATDAAKTADERLGDTSKVYFYNSDSWSNPYIWAWNGEDNYTGGNWPGTTMSAVDGYAGLYSYDLNTNANKMIFSDNGNPQTSDISANSSDWAGKVYDKSNGEWKNITDIYKTTTVYIKDGLKINGNGNTITNAYIYKDNNTNLGAWPGTAFSSNSWDSSTVPGYHGTTFTNTWSEFFIILNNGYGGDGNQTGDMDPGLATGSTYYINEITNNKPVATTSALEPTYTLYYRTGTDAFAPVDISSFTATLSLQSGKSYEYYIQKTYGSDNWYFKSPNDNDYMTRSNSTGWKLQNNVSRVDSHTYVTADETGSYTFTLRDENSTDIYLDVNYPAVSTNTTNIYVSTPSGAAPTKASYVYLFKNNALLPGHTAWPGEALSSETTTQNNYTYKKVSFEDSSDTFQFIVNGGGKQTNDSASVATGHDYYVIWDESNGNFDLYTDAAPVLNADKYSVTFKNEAKWSNVNVYLFGPNNVQNDAWPGKSITEYGALNSGLGVYELEIPKNDGYTTIIFNNGDDKQTDDLELKDGGAYTNGSGGDVSGTTTIKVKGDGVNGIYIWDISSEATELYNKYNANWDNTKSNLNGMSKDSSGYYVINIPNSSFSSSDGTFNFILRSGDGSKIETDDFKGLAIGGTYTVDVSNFNSGTYTMTGGDDSTVYFYGGSEQNPSSQKRLVGETSQNSNEYTITIDTSNYTSGTTYYAALCKTKSNVDQYFKGEGGVTVTNNSPTLIEAGKSSWNFPNGSSSIVAEYLNFKFSDDADVTSVTITCNTNTKTYTITAKGSVSENIYVYAKDGMLRYGYDNGATNYQTFANYATTTITNHTSERKEDDYDYAKVAKGKSIHVQTQIDNDHKGSIYVKGFCVNGVTYELYDYNENGLYETDIILNDDIKYVKGKYLEITPIYYYKDAQTVRFYIENFDEEVQESWGNTIAAYPFYEDVNNGDNAYGGYPGQPMIFYGGEYFLDIPINCQTNAGKKIVKGITMSNFYWDRIHGTTSDENKIYHIGAVTGHNQTYDYDDFYKIYKEVQNNNGKTPDTIKFSFKYKTTKDNEQDNSFNKSNYDAGKGNGWEYLVNGKQEQTDILDNVLTDAQKSNNPLYVVSDGYWNLYSGYYSTKWYVYDGSTYVTTISPSVRFMKDASSFSKYSGTPNVSAFTTAFNTLNTSAYKGRPVLITYEKEIRNDGQIHDSAQQKAKRSDGIWTYNYVDEKINGNIIVELSTDQGKTYPTESVQTLVNGKYQTDQGLSATFTNNDFLGKIESGPVKASLTDQFTFNAQTAGSWIFAGWWLKTADGKYQPITKGADGESSMASSSTFVARYYKAPTDKLTVNHLLSEDSEAGMADLYVKVDVTKADNSVKTYAQKLSTISNIDVATNDQTVAITLYTVTKGSGYYKKFSIPQTTNFDNTTYVDAIDNAKQNRKTTFTSPATTTATYQVSQLFTGDTLTHHVINLYSVIGIQPIPYRIDYTINTRSYGPRIYRVEGEFTSAEIHKYFKDDFEAHQTVTELTKQFVLDKAPYESNFRYETTFNENGITLGVNGVPTEKKDDKLFATAVVDAVKQTTVTGTFLFPNKTSLVKQYVYGADFDQSQLVTADATYTQNNVEHKFSYWTIVSNATGKEVARCYNVKFLYILYEDCTITAVYDQGTPQDGFANANGTTLNWLQTTRNHWNDTLDGQVITKDGKYGVPNTEFDRLYIDFAVAFNYNGVLFKDTNDEVGIEIWRDGEENSKTTVKFNNSKIDNKNRIEYYIGINNIEKNRVTWHARSYMTVNGAKVYSDETTFNPSEIGNRSAMFPAS